MTRSTLRTYASAAVILCALVAPVIARAESTDKEYKASMEKMDAAMMKAMDPDPTKAWAKMMIAHHQGAIDMSKTVLRRPRIL